MERKSCSNLHFINAIKGNLVSKLRNVDTIGKPALVFKTVKEIMEAEDAKRLQPSSQGAQCSDLKFSYARVKIESLCLPQVDRSLREIDPRGNEFVCRGGDDEKGSDSDDNMTLKQVKEKFKTKKRKHAKFVNLKLEPEEDDSDLKEPLSSFKLKLPKAKKKCVQAASGSPKGEILIKSEQNLDSEREFQRDLPSLVHVKTEIPEPLIDECQHVTPFVDDSPNINQSDESSAKAISDGAPKTVERQNSKSMLFAEEYKSCSVNEVSYDHLENVEPMFLLLPSCEDTMDVDGQEESCQQFLALPTSEYESEETEDQPLIFALPTKYDNSYMHSFSRSFRHMHEFVEQASCSHAIPVSDLLVDDCSSGKDLYHGNDSLLFNDDAKKDLVSDQQIDATSSPARTFSTSSNHPPCLSTNDDLLCGTAEQKQPLQCSSPNGVKNCLKPRNHLVLLEDKSTLDEHKKTQKSVCIGEEKQEINSSSKNENCDVDETLSTSVLVQPPERLLLTRKVISPTSQERLCLAMNSTESYIDQNIKENPCLSNQTENKASSLGSDVKHANVAGNPKGSRVVTRTEVIISPSRTSRRSKYDRRSSPAKGNLEGPRLSRSLPSVSTGCASLQGCSESAIAFSRRQMHDIESLAVKLISELKSMKDIVEEKLLFEAYRNISIKNDAEEVKNAITNATKVEETARKWLSMMARDCNRFCKIMSLTRKGTAPAISDNGIQRERKKITFADEAGGMLCHVKVFGDETTFDCNSE